MSAPKLLPYWEIALYMGVTPTSAWRRIKAAGIEGELTGRNGAKLYDLDKVMAIASDPSKQKNGYTSLLEKVRAKFPEAILVSTYVQKKGLSEKHIRRRLRDLKPEWQFSGVNFYTEAQIDEFLKPSCNKFSQNELGRMLTKRQICEKLGMSETSLSNQLTRCGVTGRAIAKQADGKAWARLYSFREVVEALDDRANGTLEAKRQNAAKARAEYSPAKKILSEDSELKEKIAKLRELGYGAAKIARLTNAHISNVWAIIQQKEGTTK